MANITVEKLFTTRGQELELTLLSNNEKGLNKKINNAELHRPGLALTGFFERFSNKRIQILGETEMSFISRLSSERLNEITSKIFNLG
ncbi:MAG: HPr kinase/phosphorylase, partial [Candidatus Zixiibacteriota bacterium]